MSGRPVMLACERLDIAGGVERFACTLANHLAGLGWRATLASVATPRERVAYALHDAVQVVHGPRAVPEGDGALAVARRQWRTGRTLGMLARDARPDVLVLNGLTTACSVLALAPSLAPVSVCCDHNHFDARSRLWRRLRERLYPRVAAVVSLTEADRPRFAALNPRTEVIANASTLRAAAPGTPLGLLVLAVARHVAQKGLDLLLAAWQRVVRELPQARLRIVGDGPLTAALQAQAAALGVQGSVQWLPPPAEIVRHYRAAALFVLPSRYEGMPLALLEAQALGVPAVAFDCPTGPREIVGPETGIVVPNGDVPALAAAVVELLRDAPRRAAMAGAAISRSDALFSPERHLARWTALLESAA